MSENNYTFDSFAEAIDTIKKLESAFGSNGFTISQLIKKFLLTAQRGESILTQLYSIGLVDKRQVGGIYRFFPIHKVENIVKNLESNIEANRALIMDLINRTQYLDFLHTGLKTVTLHSVFNLSKEDWKELNPKIEEVKEEAKVEEIKKPSKKRVKNENKEA